MTDTGSFTNAPWYYHATNIVPLSSLWLQFTTSKRTVEELELFRRTFGYAEPFGLWRDRRGGYTFENACLKD